MNVYLAFYITIKNLELGAHIFIDFWFFSNTHKLKIYIETQIYVQPQLLYYEL